MPHFFMLAIFSYGAKLRIDWPGRIISNSTGCALQREPAPLGALARGGGDGADQNLHFCCRRISTIHGFCWGGSEDDYRAAVMF